MKRRGKAVNRRTALSICGAFATSQLASAAAFRARWAGWVEIRRSHSSNSLWAVSSPSISRPAAARNPTSACRGRPSG